MGPKKKTVTILTNNDPEHENVMSQETVSIKPKSIAAAVKKTQKKNVVKVPQPDVLEHKEEPEVAADNEQVSKLFIKEAVKKILGHPSDSKSIQSLVNVLSGYDISDLLNALALLQDPAVAEKKSVITFLTTGPLKTGKALLEHHSVWKDMLLREANELKTMTEKVEVAEGVHKCRRCGSLRTMSHQKQTRSADEPMTEFITCMSCNNHWRD